MSSVSPVSVCSPPLVRLRLLDLVYRSIIGANREVKKAVEAYWAGKITADQLTQAAEDVKKSNWTSVKAKGVSFVPRFVIRRSCR